MTRGTSLALQSRFGFDMRVSGCGLMGSSPERSCDDAGRFDVSSGEPEYGAADFLDCPADHLPVEILR